MTAAENEAAEILDLAKAFDLESFGQAAVNKGQDLAAFRQALLDRLRLSREPVTWPFEFPLRKPVEVHGEQIARLTLREPTTAEFLKFGIFDADVNGEQMLDLVATLAGVAPAVTRAVPGLDMLSLTTKLSRVFRQAAS